DEREGQRADAALPGQEDRLAPAAGDPHRRVRLLLRLGDDVALRHGEEPAVLAGERLLDHQAHDDVARLLPLRSLRPALRVRSDPRVQLRRGPRAAARPHGGPATVAGTDARRRDRTSYIAPLQAVRPEIGQVTSLFGGFRPLPG